MIFNKLTNTENLLDKLFYNYFDRSKVNYQGLPLKASRIIEGDKTCLIREDGTIEETVFKSISSTIEMKLEDLSQGYIPLILQKYDAMAKEFAKQSLKHTFDAIEEATTKIGNVVKTEDKTPTFDIFCEMIDKIWLDFDSDGKAIFPTIVAGPELADKIKKMFEDIENNSVWRDKFEILLEKKKLQYYDRENNRKLVD